MKNNRPIVQLPTNLANIISAGEVVERPCSVVKELVENSIDALATQITINLEQSGLAKITITDNGIGISKEEIPIAILPHATSKISCIEDLFHIASLGFRGEALPSIASVAYLKIASNPDDYGGYYYYYQGGLLVNSGLISIPKGTIIEVSNLFYNTPARFKHLGSPQKELSLIIDYLYKSALAHPMISFTLINNDKTIFSTSGDNDQLAIIKEAYGSNTQAAMIGFSGQNNLYKILGYTTNNEIFRSNRNALVTITNGRVIKNLNLSYAITDAYKGILPDAKYPVTLLMIECDPGLIDVNIHPSKLEIKFTDESILKSLITQTINQALTKAQLLKYQKEPLPNPYQNLIDGDERMVLEDSVNSKGKQTYNPPLSTSIDPTLDLDQIWETFTTNESISTLNKEIKDEIKDSIFNYTKDSNFDFKPHYPDSLPFSNQEAEEVLIQPEKNDNLEPLSLFEDLPTNHAPDFEQTTPQSLDQPRHFFDQMRYIGQFNQTYLLCEAFDTLYLIDQHAAMERVMYEKVIASFKRPTNQCFQLLVPLTIELSAAQICLLEPMTAELAKIGLTVKFDQVAIVLTVPTWIPQNQVVEYVSDIFNHFCQDRLVSKDQLMNNLAKTISCKQSIKAKTRILSAEVENLLLDLDNCLMPYACPHGRPTIIKFSLYQLEKLFKRVM